MPELIEVEQYRAAAAELAGDVIEAVETIDPRYLRNSQLAVDRAREVLRGARVESVDRHGKVLLLATDRVCVGLRFGMTGRLLIDGSGPIERLEYGPVTHDTQADRLVMHFASGRSLSVNDARRLGALEIDPDLTRLGPDAACVSADQLRRALANSRSLLKARLLDQRRVAGLGNLLTDETLWSCGIAPTRPAASLAGPEVRRLAAAVRKTIRALSRRGGSHLGDLQPERQPGGRCPRDGEVLRVDKVGGRTTYWCPVHQR